MKIGQNPEIPVAAAPSAAKPGTVASAAAAQGAVQAKVAARPGAPGGGVPVTVSPLARTLELSSRSDVATFDAEKVNAVRTAIADGSYKVDAEAIADKLLSNAQQVLRKARD